MGEYRAPRMHFERTAQTYHRARPPYPDSLYERLEEFGVLVRGHRLLEIGAGSGQATARLVQAGAQVTAVEPGIELAAHLVRHLPTVEVVVDTFEKASATERLRKDDYESVCVATAFHWLDQAVALPAIQRTLIPHGLLAVWRHVFGDPEADSTPFRDRLTEVVSRRTDTPQAQARHHAQFDWIPELTSDGLFSAHHEEHFRWSIDLSSTQVRDLFSTFSDWQTYEVDEMAAAVDELGGSVTEHYMTTLAIVRSTK